MELSSLTSRSNWLAIGHLRAIAQNFSPLRLGGNLCIFQGEIYELSAQQTATTFSLALLHSFEPRLLRLRWRPASRLARHPLACRLARTSTHTHTHTHTHAHEPMDTCRSHAVAGQPSIRCLKCTHVVVLVATGRPAGQPASQTRRLECVKYT